MDILYQLFKKTYALIKYIFGLNKTKPSKLIRYLLILLTSAIIIIGLLGYSVLFIIAKCIDIGLKIKHGEKYGGMVKGMDLLMAVNNKVLTINECFVVKRNSSYEEFEQDIISNVKSLYKCSRKLRQEIISFLGYKYRINIEIKLDDTLTIIENVNLNKDNLLDYLRDNFTDSNAILGNKSWRVFLYKNPINWSQDSNHPRHLIILVFHHSVADGIALHSLFAKSLGGFEPLSFSNELKTLPTYINDVRLDDDYVYDNPFRRNKTFLRCNMENELAVFIEDRVKYIPLIKSIKNKLNVGFGDVLSTCLTNALLNYAKKIGKDGRDFRFGYTLQPINKDVINMMEGRFNYDNISNKLISLIFNVPNNFSQLTLTEAVKAMNVANTEMKKSVDVFFIGAMQKNAHLVTVPMARYIAQGMCRAMTACITNVFGLNSITLNGRHQVESIFPFPPNSMDIGFMLVVLSIGNKFHMCLSGPKSIVHSRKDLDDIFNDMFASVERLFTDVNN